jgi:hypothetical protein
MPRKPLRGSPQSDDLADRLEVVVDPDAEPGNVLGALADLLLDLTEQEVRDDTSGRRVEPPLPRPARNLATHRNRSEREHQ